jgi:C-terminal processing protease CtpA/Prc
MKKTLVAAASLALAIAPVLAGGDHKDGKEYKHCTMEASACKLEMQKAMSTRGWTGVELDQREADNKLVVTKVLEGSPAAASGLEKGDVLLALNGQSLAAEGEKGYEAWKTVKPGDRVKYTVERAGREKTIAVTLARMPQSIMETAIAEHMKTDHSETVATN